MENEIYKSEDELTHWGVVGMKWGVRRYQNKDGTLTKAGKKRYNSELAKVRQEEAVVKNRQAVKARMDRLEARKKAVADKKKALDDADSIVSKAKKGTSESKSGKKSYKDMTDAELKDAVARAQLENQYRQLHPEPAPKQSFGKRFLNDAAKPALINAGKNAIEKFIGKKVEDMLKDTTKEKVDYDYLKKKVDYEIRQMDYDERVKKATAKAAKDTDSSSKKESKTNSKNDNKESNGQDYSKNNYADDPVSTGKQAATNIFSSGSNKSILALPAPTVNKGKRAAVDVLDADGSVIAKFDRNGKLVN